MLFQTVECLILLCVLHPLSVILPGRPRKILLLLASLFFYSWFYPPYLVLLLFCAIFDYIVGVLLFKSRSEPARNLLLGGSLAINLGMLAYFKYLSFFTENLNLLWQLVFSAPITVPHALPLPLGISFFTFQTMSYTIDVWKGKIRKAPPFLDYLLFVSFFPHLVAGPIVKARHLLPQLEKKPDVASIDWQRALLLIAFGLFKKTVVADNLASFVNEVFADPRHYSGLTNLLAAYSFAFQIYCDFSGYTDIARGVAFMFGYDIGINFTEPYFAENIREFWRRWHISLSTWLRDYLYIPLGGDRAGSGKTYRNIMITMLLGGLWHGASWTFVVWGAFHGLWICLERRFCGGPVTHDPRMPARVAKILLTFHGVCAGWIFFRAQSIPAALEMIGRILDGAKGIELTPPAVAGILIVIAFDLCKRMSNYEVGVRRYEFGRWMLAWSLLIAVVICAPLDHHEFIYFQF